MRKGDQVFWIGIAVGVSGLFAALALVRWMVRLAHRSPESELKLYREKQEEAAA